MVNGGGSIVDDRIEPAHHRSHRGETASMSQPRADARSAAPAGGSMLSNEDRQLLTLAVCALLVASCHPCLSHEIAARLQVSADALRKAMASLVLAVGAFAAITMMFGGEEGGGDEKGSGGPRAGAMGFAPGDGVLMACCADAFAFSPSSADLVDGRSTSKRLQPRSLFMASPTKRDSEAASPSTASTDGGAPVNPAATPSASTTSEYSFFDEATIYVRAGSGGQGSSTYRRGVNGQNGPPDGGNGGRGGDVVLMLDESLNTLAGLARYAWRPNSFGGGGGAKRRGDSSGGDGGGSTTARVLSFRGENGADGKRKSGQGRNGKDVVVRVPPGTVVQEEIASQDDDGAEPYYVDVGTITHANPTLAVALGGAGGEGSAAEKLQRGVRRARSPPVGGQRKRLKLTLKVVADVALVAVPNAGKSTLLSKVTRAKPKIADYPFTTVVPNLGVWVPSSSFAYDDDEDDDDGGDSFDEGGNPIPSSRNSNSLILCDVPGLIAGASEGVGLGHAFLRHVERCHVILHLLDATSKNVLEEYAMINRELLNYGTGKLATMPQVVVVNKVDVAFDGDADDGVERPFGSKEELEEQLQKVMPHSRLMWISAKEEEGVDDLMERVAMFVRKVKGAMAAEERKREELSDDA